MVGGNYIPEENLMHSIMQVESGGDPNAISPVGAVGPYQIMPGTAANPGYGVDPITMAQARDPQVSREFSSDYLHGVQQHHGFSGDDALRVYNAGPGVVQQVNAGQRAYKPETQQYVPKVVQQANLAAEGDEAMGPWVEPTTTTAPPPPPASPSSRKPNDFTSPIDQLIRRSTISKNEGRIRQLDERIAATKARMAGADE